MKKFLIFILVSGFLVTCSVAVYAKEKWNTGDTVAVFLVCKDEDDILDIAYADSQSREKYISTINEKKQEGFCVTYAPPIVLYVQKVIVSYKDHKKRENCVLKLSYPGSKKEAGYIVAVGEQRRLKDLSF
jgi:hypothetical protein